MANLQYKLNLNKHPKNCDNLSMIDALNIKVSHDNSCLTNDDSIKEIDVIRNKLELDFTNYDIVGVIPCNTELVLFVIASNENTITEVKDCYIYRYEEKTNIISNKCIENPIPYYGGKLIGTFTYNVENNLIIAFCEHDSTVEDAECPLRTLNLGSVVINGDSAIFDYKGDYEINPKLTSIIPEVKIPALTSHNYVEGTAYKGWYHLFIRYKINKVDYTQWYNFGYPIYVDNINLNNIIRYPYQQEPKLESDYKFAGLFDNNNCYVAGCSDWFSDELDGVSITFDSNINNIDINYKYCQIGYIILSKTYTKCFKTNDILIGEQEWDKKSNINVIFKTDYPEYSYEDILTSYYNYFNINNLINYKNRLYISNYNENNKVIDENIINNIRIYPYIYNNFINLNKVITLYLQNKNADNQNFTNIYENENNAGFYTTLNKLLDIDNNTKVYINEKNIFISETFQLDIILLNDNICKIIPRNLDYFVKFIINNIETISSIKIILPARKHFYRYNGQSNSCYCNLDIELTFDISNINETKKICLSATNIKFNSLLVNIIDSKGNVKCYLTTSYNNRGHNTYYIQNFSVNLNLENNINTTTVENIKISSGNDGYSMPKTIKLVNNYIILNDKILYINGFNYIFNTNTDDENAFGYIGENEIINTKNSFDTFIKTSTLIPGEIYNFYIHFVDKYGNHTNGYRINNESYHKYYIRRNTPQGVKTGETLFITFKHNDKNYYIPFENDDTCSIFNYYEEYPTIKIYSTIIKDKFSNFPNSPLVDILSDEITDSDVKKEIARKIKNKYQYYLNTDIKLISLIDYVDTNNFGLFINRNGDKLFRVPEVQIYNYNNLGLIINKNIKNIGIKISNIQIPKDYVGYFISIEKPEYTKISTGVLTKNDFFTSNYPKGINGNHIECNNEYNSKNMKYYTSDYDLGMSSLKYNSIKIEGKNCFKTKDIESYDNLQSFNTFGYCFNYNKPQLNITNIDFTNYFISDFKLCVANSTIDNRNNLGTCLEINHNYPLFNTNQGDKQFPDIILYRVSLMNYTDNLYLQENKILIRVSETFYDEYEKIISNGFDGHVTINGFIVYNGRGVQFDSIVDARTNINNYYYVPEKKDGNNLVPFHLWEGHNIPFACYFQMPCYKPFFYESKCFNNKPEYVAKAVGTRSTDADGITTVKNAKVFGGCIVRPINSIDLFKLPQLGTFDNYPVALTNYREDILNIDRFDKTIRRSNVIQDESKENAWRKFPIEGYKPITENKGIITNLIGIGTYLLVHTEHSLFMFDLSNTLKTIDKDVQLYQPDAFDIDYKEVFTSDLGFGGLQDEDAYTVDQYGYIFYNNDFNRIYRFDNGQMDYIDDDIIEFLYKYRPNKIRFGHDKCNDRIILVCGFNNNQEIVLSYNYLLKSFISKHSYRFDKIYSTKNKVYMLCENINNCSLHTYYDTECCQYDNGDKNVIVHISKPYDSEFSIIINDKYEAIKFLEFISYKLSKVKLPINTEYISSPVEGLQVPFSGDYLTVYNDMVSTGEIDINISTEEAKNIFANFDKPYWELGKWNFNYFRNKVTENNIMSSDELSRIYGNYFIFKFRFKNEDKNRIEFENFNYSISKDKEI